MNVIKAGTLAALAPFLLNGAVKAEVFLLPPSPADHSPPTGYKGRLLAKPIFVAQANPSVVAQVAPRDGQPSNPPVVRPPNYGRSAARAIADLQGDINGIDRVIEKDDQNLVNQAEQNSRRFKDFLRNRQLQK
jgi:hypothetical protein